MLIFKFLYYEKLKIKVIIYLFHFLTILEKIKKKNMNRKIVNDPILM